MQYLMLHSVSFVPTCRTGTAHKVEQPDIILRSDTGGLLASRQHWPPDQIMGCQCKALGFADTAASLQGCSIAAPQQAAEQSRQTPCWQACMCTGWLRQAGQHNIPLWVA